MVPDTRLRLRTVLKAIDDVVSPALPEAAGLAHEQLSLIRKSLQLVIDQIPLEHAFMVRDARDHLALACALRPYLNGVKALNDRLDQSCAALEAIMPTVLPDVPILEQRLRAIKQDTQDAVEALCAEATGETLAAIERVVLDHSARRILIERAWTIGTGFESDSAAIPPVTELLAE